MIPFICYFVDESARWLTQRQHIDEAHRVLTKMARVCERKFFVIHNLFSKINKRSLPSRDLCTEAAQLSTRLSGSSGNRCYTYIDLFTSGNFCVILLAFTAHHNLRLCPAYSLTGDDLFVAVIEYRLIRSVRADHWPAGQSLPQHIHSCTLQASDRPHSVGDQPMLW